MSEVLLDTHTFLWILKNDPALSDTVRALLPSKVKHLSYASVWEIAIKLGLGKLTSPVPLPEAIDLGRRAGVRMLPVELEHIYLVQGLANHHRDPFDRIMVAQCQLRSMPIVSRDAVFDHYGVQRIW